MKSNKKSIFFKEGFKSFSPLKSFIFLTIIFLGLSCWVQFKLTEQNQLSDLFFDSFLIPKNLFLLLLILLSILMSGSLALILKLKKIAQKIKLDQSEFAKQIAHDMRSPLSALAMVMGSLRELPEDKKSLIRNATQRINDIANELAQSNAKELFPNKNPNEINLIKSGNFKIEYIPNLIDVLISKKRMQLRDLSGFALDLNLKNSFLAFAKIDAIHFNENLNSIIDELVANLPDQKGCVNLALQVDPQNQKIFFKIKNNGPSFKSALVDKLVEESVFYEFTHEEGLGNIWNVLIPLSEAPSWFAQMVPYSNKKYLISVDDDLSIHQIWAERMNQIEHIKLEHIKFKSGSEFKKYVYSNLNKIKETIFLIDYEFLNHSENGIDLIDELGIEKNSILVTSHFDEDDLLARAEQLKLKILPKSLAGFVPFQ